MPNFGGGFTNVAGGSNSPWEGAGYFDVGGGNSLFSNIGGIGGPNFELDIDPNGSGIGIGGFLQAGGREGEGGWRASSQPGSIMGPIGSVGPGQGDIELLQQDITESIETALPRDENGVPILPGVTPIEPVVNPVTSTLVPPEVEPPVRPETPLPVEPTIEGTSELVTTGTDTGGTDTGGTDTDGTDTGGTDTGGTDTGGTDTGGTDTGGTDTGSEPITKILPIVGTTIAGDEVGDIYNIGGGYGTEGSGGSSFSHDIAKKESESGGVSESFSTDTIAFEDTFARLFGGAEGASGALDPSILTNTANQLFSGGTQFLDQLSGGADTSFLEGRLGGNDDLLNEQIGALGEDIGTFFREQILPGIQSESIAGGSLGGSRQGLAEGGAASAAGREFQRGSTSLRVADEQQRLQAAGILGNSRVAGAGTGLQGLEPLSGVADTMFGAGLEPAERLSAILGDQRVLTESGGSGSDFSTSLSNSFGESSATRFSESNEANFRLGYKD